MENSLKYEEKEIKIMEALRRNVVQIFKSPDVYSFNYYSQKDFNLILNAAVPA